MKLLIAMISIAVISFLGARISFFNRRLPLGLRSVLLTGTEYIFIGALLGSMGIDLLDLQTRDQLEPFLLFGLCWVGFLFGLQFEVRRLKKLPLYYFSITGVQSLITFLVVSIPTFFLFQYFSSLPTGALIMVVATLGSTAACTAQSTLAIISRNYKIKNRKLMDFMRYMAGVDGLFALCFFTLALSLVSWGEVSQMDLVRSLQWLLVLFFAGLMPAVVLILLNRSQFSPSEFLMFLIGVNMFCAGLAHTTHSPPLVSGFVCGFFVANFCRHRLRALAVVVHAEKTIYIALLILLGASWQVGSWHAVLLAFSYLGLKIIGKYFGVKAAVSIFPPVFAVPTTLGIGLITEGGLAIAIIINFKLLYPFIADWLITIVLIAVVASELLSPRLIVSQFNKKDIIPLSSS